VSHTFGTSSVDQPENAKEFLSVFKLAPNFKFKIDGQWVNIVGDFIDVSLSVAAGGNIFEDYSISNPDNAEEKFILSSFRLEPLIDDLEYTVKESGNSVKLVSRTARLLLLYFISDVGVLEDGGYLEALDYLMGVTSSGGTVSPLPVGKYKILSIIPFINADVKKDLNELLGSLKEIRRSLVLRKDKFNVTQLGGRVFKLKKS